MRGVRYEVIQCSVAICSAWSQLATHAPGEGRSSGWKGSPRTMARQADDGGQLGSPGIPGGCASSQLDHGCKSPSGEAGLAADLSIVLTCASHFYPSSLAWVVQLHDGRGGVDNRGIKVADSGSAWMVVADNGAYPVYFYIVEVFCRRCLVAWTHGSCKLGLFRTPSAEVPTLSVLFRAFSFAAVNSFDFWSIHFKCRSLVFQGCLLGQGSTQPRWIRSLPVR